METSNHGQMVLGALERLLLPVSVLLASCLVGSECSGNTGELSRLWPQISISNPSLPLSLARDLGQVSPLLCTTLTCSGSKMERMILWFYENVRAFVPSEVQWQECSSPVLLGMGPSPLAAPSQQPEPKSLSPPFLLPGTQVPLC